jgi:hypothetical protein
MASRTKTGIAVVVAFASGAGVWSGTALADAKPPPNVGAVAQYVEVNPTLAGPRVVTPGKTATPRVSPATAHAIARTNHAIARLGNTDKAALSKNLTTAAPPVASTPATTRRAVAIPNSVAVGGVVQSAGFSYGTVAVLGGLLVLISLVCGVVVVRRRPPPALKP